MLQGLMVLAGFPLAHAADPPVEVTPHVVVHLRPELRTNPAFVAGLDDSALAVHQGLRAGVAAKAGKVSGRVDLQEYRIWGARSGSTGTEPAVHAYQGYVEVDTGSGFLRIGRQELHWHQGYFLSRAPFNPGGRSFDAVRWRLDTKSVEADVFVSQLAAAAGFVDGEAPIDVGDWFAGGQATWAGSETVTPSLLVLGKAGGATAAEPNREDWWVGPGARTTVDLSSGTRFDVDALLQLGNDSGTPRRAWQVIGRIQQVFEAGPRPGVALRFEQTSGEACTGQPGVDDCAPAVTRGMDLQFGRNFYLRGFANQFAANNNRQMAAEAFARPTDSLKLEFIASWFQLTDPEGPWERSGGALQGQGWKPGNQDPDLGWELDARALWSVSDHLSVHAGGGFLQPVGAGAALTGGDPQLYTFASSRVAF